MRKTSRIQSNNRVMLAQNRYKCFEKKNRKIGKVGYKCYEKLQKL